MSDQIKYDFTDPETGDVFPVNGTSLVSNVRDILMSRRRNQVEAKTWSMLNEAEQQDEITAVQELARDLVGKVVEVVAEKGLVCAHVAIQKFAVDVDKGIVQITSSGIASDDMLTDLAHSKGKVAKLTVVDERQFNEKSTLLVADKDQPSLLPDNDTTGDEFTDEDSAALANSGQDDGNGELSEQDVEDIGAQMDADADEMEEPDDLHDPEPDDNGDGDQEPETTDAETKSGDTETEKPDAATDDADNAPDMGDLTPMQHGQQARLKGDGPDDNPFDGGTDGHTEWAGGYEAADAEIQTLIEDGRKAGAAGEDKKKCPWKKGTDGERFWMQGWNAGQADA